MRFRGLPVIALGLLAAVACTLGARDESELSGGGAKGGASTGGASTGGAATGGASTGGAGAGGTGGTASGGAPTGGAAGSAATGGTAGGTGGGGAGGTGGAAGAGGAGGTGGGSDACVSVPEVCGDALDNDCDTVVDNGCSGLGTFVSAVTGSDLNAGTKASPVQTIAKGIANATAIGGGVDVYLAEGKYAEKVSLVEGISLLGGHQCTTASCTWVNNPAQYISAVSAVDAEGVVAGSAITQATSVDGLTLMGQDGVGIGNGRAAITIAGGTPKLTRNKIFGPSVSSGTFLSGRSIGVAISGTSNAATGTLIESNEIKAGNATTGSIGILLDGPVSGPAPIAKILKNTISSGNGSTSFGIASSGGAGSLAEGNDINGGTAANSAFGIVIYRALDVNANRINTGTSVATCPQGNSNNQCGGIVSYSGTATITNNVVLGANAPNSAALFVTEAEVPSGIVIVNGNVLDGAGTSGAGANRSAAFWVKIGTCGSCGFNGVNGRVRNNILLAGKAPNAYGVYEDAPSGKTTHPQALQNNLFFVGTGVLYRQWDGSAGINLASIAAVNGLTLIPSVGANISDNPQLNATWHISATSPCINKGTSTEAPPKDMDGEARPKGAAIDIGADEAQ